MPWTPKYWDLQVWASNIQVENGFLEKRGLCTIDRTQGLFALLFLCWTQYFFESKISFLLLVFCFVLRQELLKARTCCSFKNAIYLSCCCSRMHWQKCVLRKKALFWLIVAVHRPPWLGRHGGRNLESPQSGNMEMNVSSQLSFLWLGPAPHGMVLPLLGFLFPSQWIHLDSQFFTDMPRDVWL